MIGRKTTRMKFPRKAYLMAAMLAAVGLFIVLHEWKKRRAGIFEQIGWSNPRKPRDSELLARIISDLAEFQQALSRPDIQPKVVAPFLQLKAVMSELVSTTELADGSQNTKLPALKRNPDVCPEVFASSNLIAKDYPLFNMGFDMEKCTNVPPFPDIITMVFNMVSCSATTITSVLTQAQKVNPQVPILLAVKSTERRLVNLSSSTISFIEYNNREPFSYATTDIWKELIQKVRTRYVFVGRNVVHYSWHSRLERLVREIHGLGASVVSGSFRLMSGEWSYGCEQTKWRRFTLTYKKGYHWSRHECMMCDVVQGPFVAQTGLFKEVNLDSNMADVSGFETWFQRLKLARKVVVSCPDSMFFVSEQPRSLKESWLQLAQKLKVELIVFGSRASFKFNCEEAKVSCRLVKGQALSYCCLNELSQLMKTFFKLCKESGSLCEIREGSLLGAVKFHGFLPWERDADVTFHAHNFTAIEGLASKLKSAGYNLKTVRRTLPGVFNVRSKNWNLELFGENIVDSQTLSQEKLPPTLVEVDGMLIPTPTSPGLYSRNRYGREIYKHVQHWTTLSHSTSWDFYKAGVFTKCEQLGHPACLDQYLPDGNLQFFHP